MTEQFPLQDDVINAPVRNAPQKPIAPWPRRYASRLFFSDVVVIAFIIVAYAALSPVMLTDDVSWEGGPTLPYWLALTTIGLLWLLSLDVIDTRDERMVGHGILEYQRIARASLLLFSIVVALAFFLRIDLARSLFFVAIPVGTILLLASRWLWRKWLRAKQRKGAYVHRAVVLGERTKAEHIIRTIRATQGTGFEVLGAITRSEEATPLAGDIPVLGSFADTERIVGDVSADTVIFAGADDVSPKSLRKLGWAMADRDINWVVAPALTDVAGPRIHSRPVAGLPLIHISYPVMEGSRRVIKRTSDIIGSALLILLFSPVMIGVAIAIKIDSPGPLFYEQERIGRRGRPFGMIKFRSMVANADDQLASLLDVQGTSDQPLFKVTNDPRITKVGYFLRKHSLDELPQLFNVFRGEMSLVGPRPQRPAEVALYDDDAHRRLLVKPGMSGLWQVSGRSSLSWEDALRLDLYYVENWSFTQDIQILFRTVRAVVSPGDSAH
jgi:exopolysaccharide biosynthesis polyprenyl glycosylphosphotransferase